MADRWIYIARDKGQACNYVTIYDVKPVMIDGMWNGHGQGGALHHVMSKAPAEVLAGRPLACGECVCVPIGDAEPVDA